MSEQHAPGTDRIDQLLGSLQESRTPHSSAPEPKPSPAPRRHRSWVWILLVVLALAGAAVFLLAQGRSASLNVRSFPSNGTVLLDGQQVGTTPLVLTKVTPGAHSIVIRLSGWEDWNGTTTAVKGSTTQVIANLKHSVYALAITSTPPGATVALDGTTRGVTPLTVTGLKPRNYNLVVSLKGYAPISRTVDLSDATQTAQDFSLQQAFGKVSITSDPTGAQVLMDGKDYGKTPLKLDPFPVGDYSLTLKLDGNKDVTDTLSVTEGATVTKQYKFDLAVGGLSVETDPAGASITVDGKPTGLVTPCTIGSLQEGVHEVYLELSGYLPWSSEITVAKGESSRLNIALTKLQ
ncbi:MAG: PEGA domain-containing protein [Candidatus Cryosericum sp.]